MGTGKGFRCTSLNVSPTYVYHRFYNPTFSQDALMEATLLENRHPDAWLYLSLVCLASSSTSSTSTTAPSGPSGPTRPPRTLAQRTEEAEQAARQGLRLLATNTPLLRELGAAFMAADRFAVAEEVVRRALAVEVGASATGRPHPHTRKLLADILAVQSQALLAVDEYQQVLADGTCGLLLLLVLVPVLSSPLQTHSHPVSPLPPTHPPAFFYQPSTLPLRPGGPGDPSGVRRPLRLAAALVGAGRGAQGPAASDGGTGRGRRRDRGWGDDVMRRCCFDVMRCS